MRFSRFLSIAAMTVLLGACNAMAHNEPARNSEFSNWMNGYNTTQEKKFWRMPVGYTNQNAANKQDAIVSYIPPRGYAGQNNPAALAYAAPSAPSHGYDSNDGSVTVFPIDAPVDAPAYEPFSRYDETSFNTPQFGGDYGRKALDIYYLHGSANLTQSERNKIRGIARDVNSQSVVTVVGHASARVEGVSDPVRRKAINFEMAQRRAAGVSDVLTGAGVAPSQVYAISRGDEEPNPAPGNRSREAADRRVDIYTR